MAKKVVKKRSKKQDEPVMKKREETPASEVTLNQDEMVIPVGKDVSVVGIDLAKGEDFTVVVPPKEVDKLIESVTGRPVAKPVQPILLTAREAVVNVAGSTPTKDFAVAMCKIFDANPNIVLRVRYIGAGSGHQLTKATIEANKMLVPRGQMLSRFDFWTNEDGKSVNNARFVIADIMPHSLAQALSGKDVDYVKLDVFMGRDGGQQ